MCWRHLPQASQHLKVEGAKSWAGAARRLGWSSVREIAAPVAVKELQPTVG